MRISARLLRPSCDRSFDLRHDLTPGRSVGAQLFGDNALGRDALLSQEPDQQSFGSLGVAPGLDDLIAHIAILIYGTPQRVLLAGDSDDDFIEMTNVIVAWRLAAQATSIIRRPYSAASGGASIRSTWPKGASSASEL
jgi:hypothetical protein